MKRKYILILALILVIITVIMLSTFKKNKNKGLAFNTVQIAYKDLRNEVTATGTVEPIIQVEVGTQVSGVIKKIYVDYNSTVKKGQLLAELDKTILLAQVAEIKASLASAMNELDYQGKNLTRIKQLFENKNASQVEYETALYKFNSAKASVDRINSELSRTETNLSYASIYSPIDGVVLSRAVDEGQTVAASFNTPTLFTIANDLTKMQVIADVDEADIGQIKVGQRVSFTVDAFPDMLFDGTITQVRLDASVNSNVVTYSVVLEAPNPQLKLMPGMTASITVYTEEHINVAFLPNQVFRLANDENFISKLKSQPFNLKGQISQGDKDSLNHVYVITNQNTIEIRAVKKGFTDGISTEIIEGVGNEEKVIAGIIENVMVEKQDDGGSGSPFLPKPPSDSNKKK